MKTGVVRRLMRMNDKQCVDEKIIPPPYLRNFNR